MQFNQYSLYTYQTEDFKNATNEKILVDLQRLKSIKDYDDVVDYVQKVIGSIDNEENYFDYPDDIKVIVLNEPDKIRVFATKNEKQVFGRFWQLVDEDKQ